METARAGKDTNTNTNVYEKYGKYVHTNTEKKQFLFTNSNADTNVFE